jgi:hypothetical protein
MTSLKNKTIFLNESGWVLDQKVTYYHGMIDNKQRSVLIPSEFNDVRFKSIHVPVILLFKEKERAENYALGTFTRTYFPQFLNNIAEHFKGKPEEKYVKNYISLLRDTLEDIPPLYYGVDMKLYALDDRRFSRIPLCYLFTKWALGCGESLYVAEAEIKTINISSVDHNAYVALKDTPVKKCKDIKINSLTGNINLSKPEEFLRSVSHGKKDLLSNYKDYEDWVRENYK